MAKTVLQQDSVSPLQNVLMALRLAAKTLPQKANASQTFVALLFIEVVIARIHKARAVSPALLIAHAKSSRMTSAKTSALLFNS